MRLRAVALEAVSQCGVSVGVHESASHNCVSFNPHRSDISERRLCAFLLGTALDLFISEFI